MMKTVIEMAKEAHHRVVTEDYPGHTGQLDRWTMKLLERFANLVEAAARADEREACAELCDMRTDCADAIRERGTT